MSPEQVARIAQLKPTALHAIPDGSWFAVRRAADGVSTWLEVIDPEASSLLAWDLGDESSGVRAVTPQGPRP